MIDKDLHPQLIDSKSILILFLLWICSCAHNTNSNNIFSENKLDPEDAMPNPMLKDSLKIGENFITSAKYYSDKWGFIDNYWNNNYHQFE